MKEKTLLESIKREKEIFVPIKEISNLIIDTTKLRTIELEGIIKNNIHLSKNSGMNVHIQSFGFKYGIPLDSDLIFDVRFISNPYYIEELKDKNGFDKEVIDFISNLEESSEFYDKLKSFIDFLLPNYIKEGKKHLTISMGCSGGQHRSVFFANKLASDLKKNNDINIYISHREKESGHW